jgi:hypothetical protein
LGEQTAIIEQFDPGAHLRQTITSMARLMAPAGR